MIKSLPVWVRFPVLPVEYYKEDWLKRAGDRIGKMIRVDDTTRALTRGKFARVCIEIKLLKPLKAGYKLRGQRWRLQYERLHDLCFICGQYGYKEVGCPKSKQPQPSGTGGVKSSEGASSSGAHEEGKTDEQSPTFGPWTVVQHNGRRPSKT